MDSNRTSQNLNNITLTNHNTDSQDAQEDYSTVSADGSTQVYFKDIEAQVIRHILQADVVVGCVAWLTSEPILCALAELRGVSLVVQKEDFLRPDLDPHDTWLQELRALYDNLPSSMERHWLGGLGAMLSTTGDLTLDAVRCVGNLNMAASPAFPRAHHKFIVFCQLRARRKTWSYDDAEGNHVWSDFDDEGNEIWYYYNDDGYLVLTSDDPTADKSPIGETPPSLQPYAVWTGSFNFTRTSGASFENAIVLTDPTIIRAFYNEYEQVLAFSEPLDWTSPWVAPQWRIGS